MICVPAEKPSRSDSISGSTWSPVLVFFGKVCGRSHKRLPVGLASSGLVHTFEGNGNAQTAGTSGSHSAPARRSSPKPPPAPPAPTLVELPISPSSLQASTPAASSPTIHPIRCML
jgi:hypothetical protein